jgi:drug/metabolite transporter (DMT)-like permease
MDIRFPIFNASSRDEKKPLLVFQIFGNDHGQFVLPYDIAPCLRGKDQTIQGGIFRFKLFLNFLFGFLCLLVIVPVVSGFRLPGGISIWAAIYVGLFEAGITYVLWMKALKLSANTAATGTMIYASPFISLVFISVVLKENIHLTTVAGLVLIVAGIVYMQKQKTG